MMPYLKDSMQFVRNLIDEKGISALYDTVVSDGVCGPRYEVEFLLADWELDDILCELKIEPISPTLNYSHRGR